MIRPEPAKNGKNIMSEKIEKLHIVLTKGYKHSKITLVFLCAHSSEG